MEYVSALKSVYTQPFIGNFYFDDSNKGHRILVVGHNHYCEHPDSEFTQSITLTVLAEYLSARREGGKIESHLQAFYRFEKAMLNNDNPTPEESLLFWNRIAFYNYVQYPNTTKDKIKVMKSQQYKDSYDGFFEILNYLKPDSIIVWGTHNYEKLPPKNFTCVKFDDHYACIYHLENDYNVKVLGIHHPSVAFTPEEWAPIIERFLHTDIS